MPRKAAKKYGPGGQYYRKRLKRPDGTYEDIYGRTTAELEEKVLQKQNEWISGKVKPQELYFFEYARAFYGRKAPHLSPDRRKVYEYQINSVICPVIGGKLLVEITLDDLKDVLATRAQLSRRSQKDTVLILKQIFEAALDADVITKDPARKLKAEGRAPAKKAALTEEQQELLLEAVHGLKVEPMVMLGLYAGLRRGEICGLRWDSVHLEDEVPYIQVRRACRWPDKIRPEVREELKSPAAFRSVPIPPQLLEYLKALRAAIPAKAAKKLDSRYVYCDAAGGPVSYSTMRRRWETIKARSTASGRELGERIPKHKVTVTLDFMPTPHILRHTYVTRLVLSGMDLKRVQYLVGHSDPEITLAVYTSLQRAKPEELSADVWAAFDGDDSDD